MIYHAIYYFDTEKEARQRSAYFNSRLVNGTASVFHGDGVCVPFHVHVLVDVVRRTPFSKDVYNVPGCTPYAVSVVEDLYSIFDYLFSEDPLTLLIRYGSLDKKYNAYLRASRPRLF